jgi:signal transduction histidine kinase/DNA-binding response OmpR family regulator
VRPRWLTTFRDLPIRRKLLSLILRTSAISALLVSLFLLAYEHYWAPRADEIQRLDLFVKGLRSSLEPALGFYGSLKDVRDVLDAAGESLGETLVTAAVYDLDGKPIAEATGARPREVASTVKLVGTEPRLKLFRSTCAGNCEGSTNIGLRNYIWVQRPIVFGDERVGTVKVLIYRTPVNRRALIPGAISFVIVLVVGCIFALRHQKKISGPIEALAAAAADVAKRCDYRTRVPRMGNDEIGRLTDTFNDMLLQIEHREKALQEKNRELLAANARANAASEAKSTFLANVSHELRTPLTAIIGFAEYDVDKGVENLKPDMVYSDLEIIYSSGKHLLHLINTLLDFSKVEAGKMPVDVQPFDLVSKIDEIRKWLERELARRGNVLDVQLSPSLGTLVTDGKKVQQIVINLLNNANKFTEDGTITIAADAEMRDGQRFLRLSVTDTGSGIPSERLENLFQPFFTAGDRARHEGTGLGLTISRQFAQLMGGDIMVNSSEGVGSTFTVVIPTAIHSTVDADTPAAVEDVLFSLPLKRVLVIDDDPATRELIHRIVSPEGFEVVQAGSGEEGLRVAHSQRPDMIILDVILPGMNGWSVLTTLKADDELADIPVVLLTILDDCKRAYALGATDFLVKPIDRERLVATTKKYRSPVPPSTVLVVDDDADCRLTVRKLLERENWAVVEAENGHVALDWLDRNAPPALILLDLVMPEMDGFRFVEEKRKRGGERIVPVVVLTAKDMTAEERHQLRGGVDEILQKGVYTPEQFDRTVRSLVSAYGLRGGDA